MKKGEKYWKVQNYIDESTKLLILLRDMVESWKADHGEMNTYSSRKEYVSFLLNVKDNFEPNSYVRDSIIVNLKNMTYFAQRASAKYGEIRISEIEDEVGEAFSIMFDSENSCNEKEFITRVNRNFALETKENGYRTIVEWFEKFIYDLFYDVEIDMPGQWDRLQNMDISSSGVEPIIDMVSLKIIWYPLEVAPYLKLFEDFLNNITKRLDDEKFLDDIYKLCQKFPVKYDEYYDEVLVRKIDLTKPYIELEYNINFFGSDKSIGKMHISELKDYKTTTVRLKFVNLDMRRYQPQGEVLENSYYCMSTGNTYGYAEVEWGKWLDDNTLELKIIKNNSYSGGIGSLKVKIWVNEKPDVVAFISA